MRGTRKKSVGLGGGRGGEGGAEVAIEERKK